MLDADGKVMPHAQVLFYRLYTDSRGYAASEKVDAKGHAHLRIANGWYSMTACAPGYQQQSLTTDAYLYGQHAELRFRLQAVDISAGIDRVAMLSQAERFATGKGLAMTKEANGTWSVDVPCANDSLVYQLALEITGSRVPVVCSGNHFDALYYTSGRQNDNNEVCCSVLKCSNGKAHVVFDPKSVGRTKGQGVAVFVDKAGREQAMLLQKEREFMTQYMDGVSAVAAAKPSTWDVEQARENLQKAFESEHDPDLKELAMLIWLELTPVVIENDHPSAAVIDRILSTVPATSLVWERAPVCVMWAVRKSSKPESEYGYEVKTKHPNDWVKQIVQTDQGTITRKENETRAQLDNARRLIAAMKAEPAKDDEIGAVRRGYPLPPFSFESLESADVKITNSTLLGKWVLVDNWATWCGPCVREMPALHAAFEKFKDKNFTILSVSFDRQKEDIVKFRKDKTPMPWMQCFSPGVWSNEASRIFEAHSIPKPILIDPNGTIRAIGVELRGANLEQTLARYIH